MVPLQLSDPSLVVRNSTVSRGNPTSSRLNPLKMEQESPNSEFVDKKLSCRLSVSDVGEEKLSNGLAESHAPIHENDLNSEPECQAPGTGLSAEPKSSSKDANSDSVVLHNSKDLHASSCNGVEKVDGCNDDPAPHSTPAQTRCTNGENGKAVDGDKDSIRNRSPTEPVSNGAPHKLGVENSVGVNSNPDFILSLAAAANSSSQTFSKNSGSGDEGPPGSSNEDRPNPRSGDNAVSRSGSSNKDDKTLPASEPFSTLFVNVLCLLSFFLENNC